MTEVQFSRLFSEQWKQAEKLVTSANIPNPDDLINSYVLVSEDLSWARTFYPESKTEHYLNQLTIRLYSRIYRNKIESSSHIRQFWTIEFPSLIQTFRSEIIISACIFIAALLFGILASLYNNQYPVYILGKDYVNTTLENIANGDPLAIYRKEDFPVMFGVIAINNLWVSLYMFLGGLLAGFGTGYLLISNGNMVGSFFSLFIINGVDPISAMGVFIHGTIELTMIIFAGAAGLRLFRGFWFPGTYSRSESFKNSAFDGMKLIIGISPFIILAAALESIVTRFYLVSPWVTITVISISILTILWYFIIQPKLIRKGT